MDFKVVYYVSVGVLVSCSFFFKQKTAYEMRISDWSSDVCSSDLVRMMAENAHARGESCSRTTSTRHCRASVSQYRRRGRAANGRRSTGDRLLQRRAKGRMLAAPPDSTGARCRCRSEEHTSDSSH